MRVCCLLNLGASAAADESHVYRSANKRERWCRSISLDSDLRTSSVVLTDCLGPGLDPGLGPGPGASVSSASSTGDGTNASTTDYQRVYQSLKAQDS